MRRNILRIGAMLLLIVALAAMVYGLHVQSSPEYDDYLNIAFIGTTDDADCIVLWQKDFAMMIDTGEERDAGTIMAFLSDKNITKIDYMVLTHPNKDHIGSASAIFQAIDVNTVVQPFYQKENTANKNLLARLAQNKVRVVIPSRVMHYTINDLHIYIYPPQEKSYTSDNNYSLAVLVRHRNVSALFTGDAENRRIAELLKSDWGSVDLYKLPHHGKYSENSAELFSLLQPTYTIVTDEEADERMVKVVKGWETEWFFTVGNTVEFLSNGDELKRVSGGVLLSTK